MNNPMPSTFPESSDSEKILKATAKTLYGCIEEVLLASKERPRHFVETVELQIYLRNYNARKHKCFKGYIRLPYIPRKKLAVCVIGNQAQCDEAESHHLSAVPVTSLKEKAKTVNQVRKLAKRYRGFIASEPVIKKIPRNLANGLGKMDKFPVVLPDDELMLATLEDVEATVKFIVKGPFIGIPVGNVSMTQEALAENVTIAMNNILAALEQRLLVIRSMHIKSTMGPPKKLY
ncbi:large ribosomal subunit protein uL1 isoform X1 [Rhipicephalus microplus]|uniref:large ribosomal subunit protein uL1 isoform X1 n=1 Tax=Rhipicephalus microplus TaxID=6941 RepID=UPI003F6B946B